MRETESHVSRYLLQGLVQGAVICVEHTDEGNWVVITMVLQADIFALAHEGNLGVFGILEQLMVLVL